jgi:gamma-glutamylcyclotransferase (GGCT)/AIG2-like uncharacterized protein YtfP
MNQLFVYGSLRSGFHSHAYEYIRRYFTLVGNAKVRGKMFDLGEYPAGVKSNDNSFIIGELYRIINENEIDWAIAQLDDYEGVSVEPGETPLYKREIADVHFENNITPAWIYWYNGDVNGKPSVESGDILEYMKAKKSGS